MPSYSLATLPDHLARKAGIAALAAALHGKPGEIAVVSSFGADSAVLLAVVAAIAPQTPVLFLQTGKHFTETLAYRDQLAAHLGLTDVRSISPDPIRLAKRDPDGDLHRMLPDDCCDVRKVGPLEHALLPFTGWVTGRRRDQAHTRSGLGVVEREGGRSKFNPLADWSKAEMDEAVHAWALPAHSLAAQGFTSIGCAPCTRKTFPGEDPRAGRWAGQVKTECGIHKSAFIHSQTEIKSEEWLAAHTTVIVGLAGGAVLALS